ncbi:hypothetical protein N7474_000485 [Penicillium riverlandense]|uniref:uncharacterized protein n=1 Tax=Penicillium riverlandense TaxID=1903569 RepID=UPI002547422C|nr:uncharacterized protein N7474_000485 [Penicillium riverlandense]KAJ5832174.1 hypothetical protein N7474_000485 [Penicillium riverlandense]
MADPYNPYTSYSTPTPGGVSYYPPAQDAPAAYQYQQPYDYSESGPRPDPNHVYAPQPAPYHLAPEPYHGVPAERSYTPVGQPDHLGPVATGHYQHAQGGKVPENLGYYGHPSDPPRHTPSPNPHPHPPAVYVSDGQDPHHAQSEKPHLSSSSDDPEGDDRGLGSSLAGGAAGYFLGHKKDHGLLGALGGAILGNYIENKAKEHKRHSSQEPTRDTVGSTVREKTSESREGDCFM